MAGRRNSLVGAGKTARARCAPAGAVELVRDADHFTRVVIEGLLTARTGLDISTADFKAMLIPTGGRRKAKSIVAVLRELAAAGVEIRVMHSGVPSSRALVDLRKELPERITIRRCPRLHAKAVIVDCSRMYLGSANLTGAGLGAKSPHKRNFEMGVWTTAPALIDAALEEFNAIWEGRHCNDCRRKAICPVPLEEPQLTGSAPACTPADSSAAQQTSRSHRRTRRAARSVSM